MASKLEQLEAKKLELEIEGLSIKNEAAKRLTDLELAEGPVHGRFEFITFVHDTSVHMLIKKLERYSKMHPGGDIEILLNSGGGNVLDGMALVDYLLMLRKRGHFIRIVGVGIVASMASAILMAADERVITPRCWIGLHEVSAMVEGSLTDHEDATKFVKAMQDQIVDLLTERSTFTKRNLQARWRRKDVYIGAKEALELGLVDRIEDV